MTAKIKLNAASGGGSFSLQAPSSSSNNRVITLPDIADGTLVTSQSTLDATKLSGNLPALNGSALTNLPGGGKILQVVSTSKTDTFSTTSPSFTDITGLNRTITPTAASSKIYIVTSIQTSGDTNSYVGFLLILGSSTIVTRGGGSGSRTRASFGTNFSDPDSVKTPTFNFLHTPSYTLGDNLTYKVQVISGYQSKNVTVNRPKTDTDATYSMRGTSTITLMEIAA